MLGTKGLFIWSHPTYRVNVIICTGGLPYLSGLPHLPGVPHLHVNWP